MIPALEDARPLHRLLIGHIFDHAYLAIGAGRALLDKAGVSATLASGAADPGIVLAASRGVKAAATAFIQAVALHRHPAREADAAKL